MLSDRSSPIGLAHRSHEVPRLAVRAASVVVDAHATGAVDKGAGTQVKRPQTHAAPRRVFPELNTEERIYGAAAAVVVEWREAWAECKAARLALGWLRWNAVGWSWNCA